MTNPPSTVHPYPVRAMLETAERTDRCCGIAVPPAVLRALIEEVEASRGILDRTGRTNPTRHPLLAEHLYTIARETTDRTLEGLKLTEG